MDAGLVGELAHKTKHASTPSETTSLPEQKGFKGFVHWTHRILLVSQKNRNNSTKTTALSKKCSIFAALFQIKDEYQGVHQPERKIQTRYPALIDQLGAG